MALNTSDFAAAYQSALAAIRSLGTSAQIGDVIRMLVDRFPGDGNTPYTTYLNIVMQADRNWRQATALNADGDATFNDRNTPIDPTITAGQPRYAYRVVVKIDDGQGNVTETLVVVRSDNSLSGDEVKNLAISEVQAGSQESTTNPGRLPRGGNPTYTAVIVSAGRAR